MSKRVMMISVLIGIGWYSMLSAQKLEKAETKKEPWGTISQSKNLPGILTLQVKNRPEGGVLTLTRPFANITRAYLKNDMSRSPLPIIHDADASKLILSFPKEIPHLPVEILAETVEKSLQYPDGRIVFSALDACIGGEQARLETQPGNHRIGFWTSAEDYVTWEYKATRPGMYQAELIYSCAGPSGNEIEVVIGEKKLSSKLASTRSWYKYSAIDLGKIYFTKPGPRTIKVACTRMLGPAVMNLKAITLRPTSEGKPIYQAEDGIITFHARDATVHGVKVQYEPKPQKNTIGYWVNPQDWVSWDATIATAGEYRVEILQGCGRGQGGSEVNLITAGKTLPFVVKDTGHFQNFVPREIGTVKIDSPGNLRLEVRPVKKAKVAVMDLRQVRLIPVDG